MNDSEYAYSYLENVKQISEQLKSQKLAIAKIIEILFDARKNDKWVFVIGNGGSASTASHLSADLVKTVVKKPGEMGIKAIALVDNIPLNSALVNDWGWASVYEEQLRTYWMPGSVVIGISVHGGSGKDQAGAWSQNLLRAMQFTKDNGGIAISLSGFDGGAMKDLADACVVVPADSTPLVESFHVVLHHLIVFRLKEKIQEYKKGGNQ